MAAHTHQLLRLAVDLVILTVRDNALQVLLVERGNQPYRGQLALPGGFVRATEDLPAAAARELAEETALDASRLHLEQLSAYGAPDRDPRGRVVSVAYLAIAPNLPLPVAGSDAAGARWEPVDAVTPPVAGARRPGAAQPGRRLAFDHDQIVSDAVERARQMLEYTTVATAFCADRFTIGELRHVYEVIWGMPLDPRNFNRKVTNTEGFAVPTGERRAQETGRPAALYRRGPATTLYPQMLRPKLAGNGAAGTAGR
ncbi:MAG TPA: NUDIX domain-containing protein [Micromonosporaceae bacterium]|nr:NUDIX domain-containing protein [Micromonosporaceae bacterium]